MCGKLEKILEALKIIGGIAKTVLSGMEEYRKIQETKIYRENKKKYLPKQKRKYTKKR